MRKYFSLIKFSGYLSLVILIFAISSCEKEVHVKLSDGDPSLVVEGAIETGVPPYVVLTTSIGYFAKIDLNTLQNSFVHGAVVKVSDGTKTVNLKEYTIDTGALDNKFSFYSIDINDPAQKMLGEQEKMYKLTIEYKGKTYESSTKIPTPTPLDSVITIVPAIIPKNNPDVRQLKIFFKDPDTAGNFVRYFTKRNKEMYYPGLNSVYSDELINNTYFQTPLSAGENRNTTTGRDSLGFFHPGDSVILKWCAIDKRVYDFYNTFEYAIGTLGSPFATPISVKTNISNGGLGVWAGYGSIYYPLVIK
jgi:hypothetical protein